MGKSFPGFLYYPTDGEAICGASLELRDGIFPVAEKNIQIENEKIKISISDSQLVSEDNFILPEIFVETEYLARNLASQGADVELGFPVMQDPYSFKLLEVTADGKEIPHQFLSHEKFTQAICEEAGRQIDENVKLYPELSRLVDALSAPISDQERDGLKEQIINWAQKNLKFRPKNSILLGEYYFLKNAYEAGVKDISFYEYLRKGIDIYKVVDLHTKILDGFNDETDLNYFNIFQSWGGDERSLSVDSGTKQLRPRENSLASLPDLSYIYGRKNYTSVQKDIADKIKESLSRIGTIILLTPYSYPPMALAKYKVSFGSTGESQRIRIKYRQIMCVDIKDKQVSAQFQYILKPAQGKRKHQGGEIIAKVPKGNNLVIFPSLEFKAARDKNYNIYKGTFKNNNTNLYLGISAV